MELPREYNFGCHAPYRDMKEVSDYLLGRYRALLAMDDPQMEPTGGDYTYSGEQMYEITAYDGAGDKTQRLLSYSFHRASFSCDEEGKLRIIRLDGTDLSQKVGDYPVITPEAARKLLEEGRYITNVPHELPGIEYVKEVELLYLSGRREQYFMPYYRFLVELPQETRGRTGCTAMAPITSPRWRKRISSACPSGTGALTEGMAQETQMEPR